MKKCKIVFKPEGKKVEVAHGTDLLTAAISAGVYLTSNCGGEGVCGRCKVIVKKGKYAFESNARLSDDEIKKKYVIACLTTVMGDMEVFVPQASKLHFERLKNKDAAKFAKKVLSGKTEEAPEGKAAGSKKNLKLSSLTRKIGINLPQPDLNDKISDADRLLREINKVCGFTPVLEISHIRKLGRLLRSSDWAVIVTIAFADTPEITNIEPGNSSIRNFGFAFDIGTTTISGQLVDLDKGTVLGTRTLYNKQLTFGDDVITRIIFAGEKNGLKKLHAAAAENINTIIEDLTGAFGVSLSDVTVLSVAGNTTMMHLLYKIDPEYIRREPYTPAANFLPTVKAKDLGIEINPRAILVSLPGVSTYVGGDITAGVLSSGFYSEKPVTLIVDIGTNGEIALGNEEWIIAASASAGPAFEGTGVACGMRAATGAIEDVTISPDFEPVLKTIKGAKPRGICGSGYIALLGEMFRSGVMDRSGKIDISRKTKRIRKKDGEAEYVIAFKEESGVEYDIVIKESDIDNLKRSKGAIYSAIMVLLKKVGMDISAISRIYIAGGFGNFIDIDKAVCIGLLPDIPRQKYLFIGNSSLAGAREALLYERSRADAAEIARKMTYMELSLDNMYSDEYVASLFFPHTDIAKFSGSCGKKEGRK